MDLQPTFHRDDFEIALKVAFFLSIHPMRAQNTPLNSILFNVEMLLISTAVSRMHKRMEIKNKG